MKNLEVQCLPLKVRMGKSMLRPDLTVASSINYLQKKTKSKFITQVKLTEDQEENSDFINDQLGIEIFGSKNQIRDDFKVISTILNSAEN